MSFLSLNLKRLVQNRRKRILVLGGGILAQGMRFEVARRPHLKIVMEPAGRIELPL